MSFIPVILSGGAGTRLWPMSTQTKPKQFHRLSGDKTLFQQTVLRGRAVSADLLPIVIANSNHAARIMDDFAEIGAQPGRLILEPVGRNTAAAIAMAALEAPATDALLLVMPSDHVIKDVAAFAAAIRQAEGAARDGWLVTFGIAPDQPATGYGYIRLGDPIANAVHKVARFVEKPDEARAAAMIAQGDHVWNAGLFLFRADRLLEEMRARAPGIVALVERAIAAGTRDALRIEPDARLFAEIEAISIDYAVMEKSARVAVVPVNMGWSDVGSWDALHELEDHDGSGNVIDGDVIALDTGNCLLKSTGVRIATLGVRDLVIVATGETVLVIPRNRAQDVRKLTAAAGQTDASHAQATFLEGGR